MNADLDQSQINAQMHRIMDEDNTLTMVEMNALKTSVVQVNNNVKKWMDHFMNKVLDQINKIESAYTTIRDKVKEDEHNPFGEKIDLSALEKHLTGLKHLVTRGTYKDVLQQMERKINTMPNQLGASVLNKDPQASLRESTLCKYLSIA